jgi:hypothetical protein
MKKFSHYPSFIIMVILGELFISKSTAQVFSKYGPAIPAIQYFIEAQNGGFYGLSDVQDGIQNEEGVQYKKFVKI